ncbi:MAG: lactonase family protein [Bacteroidales bacterium]|nr:lactonase family protein [Bacteroidales bacterium]
MIHRELPLPQSKFLPDGKFVYASNRGSNNDIAIYSVNQTSGTLTLIGHQSTKGKGPRDFTIDPSGKFLLVAHQNSNTVVVFTIGSNGLLTDANVQISVSQPVCLKFMQIKEKKVTTGLRDYYSK